MQLNGDSFNDLLPGKFYGADDVRNGPVRLVVAGYEAGKLKGTDGAESDAGFIKFEGTDRRLIVKPNVVEALKEMFPTRTASIGQEVELYFEPSVMFSGKKVGGIRVRKPTGAAAAPF